MKNKNNFAARLKSYSTLAGGMLVLPHFAAAQFIFNDIPNDVVVDAANPVYGLDLNGDGNADLNFEHGKFLTSDSGYYNASFKVTGVNAKVRMEFGFFFYSGCAGAYGYGSEITDDSDNGFWVNGALLRNDNNAGPQLNFHNNSFLGVRLYSSPDYYFGWVRLHVNKQENILSKGLNSIKKEGIITGHSCKKKSMC